VGVTEKLASYVKVPDAGLVGGTPESGIGLGNGMGLNGGGGAGNGNGNGVGVGPPSYRDPGSVSGLFGMDTGGSLGLGMSP
jgi:hypothetical protein